MTVNPFAPLDALPRIRIAHLPTPIEPLPQLSATLGGPELWIKRDDQTGLATGGNKARKLDYLLAQALAADANCVITAGSTQSNHARQTAAGAARCGLGAHLVIYTPDGAPPAERTGNLMLMELLGATIHWTTEHAPYANTIAQVEADLTNTGQSPYVIPYGGSSPYGMLGYANAMREFAAQARGLEPFDAHIFATSSGGTQAGMLLGVHLARLPDVPLVGISVDEPAASLTARVIDLTRRSANLLGMDWKPDPAQVLINDSYLGGGYAVVGEPEREAIQLMARHEGILLDPVYTGRAFAGLIDLIRRGEFIAGQRVLFWHTGGYAALGAFVDVLGL